MKPAQLRLKRPAGWFAAGREIAEALALLSDAGFKLFVWLCLHADRNRGALKVNIQQTARVLGWTEAEVTEILRDLFLKEICLLAEDGSVEITDRFWPYERSPASRSPAGIGPYIARVKELMLAHACVRSAFTAADHRLALQLHDRGICLEHLERAIHLGCLRKYAALLNHQGGTPITTLHYFTALLAEVQRLNVSPDYWRYVALKVERLERQWLQSQPAPAACETK